MSNDRGPRPDEQQQRLVENEITALLRDGYGVRRGDLDLSPEQQRISNANAQEALQQITSASPFERAHRTRSRRLRWAFAGAAVAAAVAAGVVMAFVPLGPSPPSAHASTPPLIVIKDVDPSSFPLTGTSADARLDMLAARAAAQPAVTGSGPIQRVESSGWWLDTEQTTKGVRSVLVPVDVQRFLLPGDRLRLREARGEPITAEGALGDADPGSTSGDATTDETFPIDDSNPLENPDQLPTRVSALRKVLLGPDPDECSDVEAYCIARAMRSLNLTFVLDPQLQAALIASLRGEEDIAFAGHGRDRVGRDVDVLVVTDPDGLHQHLVLFDPATGAWVGDETVLTRASADVDVEPPAVIEFNAITDRALISPKELPPPAPTTRSPES